MKLDQCKNTPMYTLPMMPETFEKSAAQDQNFAIVDNETLWTDILLIELENGQKLKGVRDSFIINVEGILIWIGHIEGQESANDVFLTMSENDKTGKMTIEGELYLVRAEENTVGDGKK